MVLCECTSNTNGVDIKFPQCTCIIIIKYCIKLSMSTYLSGSDNIFTRVYLKFNHNMFWKFLQHPKINIVKVWLRERGDRE